MRLTTHRPAPRPKASILCAAVFLFAVIVGGCAINPDTLPVSELPLPQDTGPVTLQELSFDEKLDRLIVPGGKAGVLFLINPETQEVSILPGSRPGTNAQNPSGGGVVSADRGQGLGRDLLFVLDQDEPALHAVDPKTKTILASALVKDRPETVRYIPTVNEIWVTEPDIQEIEVFKLTEGDPAALETISSISVPSGPIGLTFDASISLVYTNQPKIGLTSAYLPLQHELWRSWGNGCAEARGMALDEAGGYLYVACKEGKLVAIDPRSGGIQVASRNFGDDLNHINYNSQTGHIYLPSGASAILGVFTIAKATPTPEPTPEDSILGFLSAPLATPEPTMASSAVTELTVLQQLGSADTALKANCIASDPNGNVWVCDPDRGMILWIKDTLNKE